MKSILIACVFAAGCTVGDTGGGGGGGGSGGVTPDAAAAQVQADGGGDGGAGGVACTGAVYDPCTDPAQCMSGRCQLFSQSGFQVCTQTCTPGDSTTCPAQNGQPAQCNGMGICKPAAANACTR